MVDGKKNREKGMAAFKVVLIAAVLLAGSVLGVYLFQSRTARDKAAGVSPGGPTAPPREVAVVTVQPEKFVLTTELSGRVSASLVAEVRPQVSGIILKRLFTEGSFIEAGAVLYLVDPAPFQAAVKNAEANLTGAREGVVRAKAALEASVARVRQQEAVLDQALKTRDRLEKLALEGAVSTRERDDGVTAAEVAEAALRFAQAQVRSDQGAVEAAEAGIGQAEAALETARINLGYTRVTAPITGRIGRSSATVGALVTAHQPVALATIQKMDPVFVDVPQSTAELLRLRRRVESGQLSQEEKKPDKVRLILEDDTEYEHSGTLEFRDVTVDPSTGSVNLRIVFPNPQGILLPGMFVRAVVTEGVSNQAIFVPQQAVTRDPKGNPMTLVVDAAGKVAVKMLTLDRAIGDRWLISGGLTAGDRVIVEGMQWVRPGSPVNAVPFGKSEKEPEASGGTLDKTAEPA
jgi:membrane fusion protein (multidrug efflux system)